MVVLLNAARARSVSDSANCPSRSGGIAPRSYSAEASRRWGDDGSGAEHRVLGDRKFQVGGV
jgi:hypothetical protein